MIPYKLIFIMPSIKSGGGNRVFIELANSIKSDFVSTSILYTNNSTEVSQYANMSTISLIPVGKVAVKFYDKISNGILLMKKVNEILKTDEQSIVIFSDPILCIFYYFFKAPHKKNIIRFVQADDYRIYDDLHTLKKKSILAFYKWLCRKTYKIFGHYVFNSVYTFDQFRSILKKDVPCEIVHPGINTEIFKSNNIRDESKLNICLIARVHPWKGFSDFLSAWNILPNDIKAIINNVVIISHDNLSNFDIPSIFEIVKPNSDDEIAEIMNKSHIFISTSWWEGFGLPPLEAMACGCAVLSSNSKGILEYAVDRHNCLLYEPKNVDNLCNELIKLITDPALRNKIILNGIKDAKQFNWSNMAKQFKTFIKKYYGIK